MIFAIRPDSWNFPLLLHVGGAMLLVASLTVAIVAFVQSWREPDPGGSAKLFRFGARTMLFAALPAFLLMRIAAEWIVSREHLSNSNATWIGIGFGTSDVSGLILIVTLILTGIAVRRSRRGGELGKLAKVGGALPLLLMVLYLVAIWAMTTKPS
ncbi:MAG TPA: hypothetical protein VGQ45_10470 [Gaiellales bacterium]|jgi:hypothetical protein|nr:hypothetical protein [Gaiellales bacterium]